MAKENNYDIRKVQYRKADGSVSDREVIEFAPARDTSLMLQVNSLTPDQRENLQSFLRAQKEVLNAKLTELGVEFKSFKPGMLTYLDGPQ